MTFKNINRDQFSTLAKLQAATNVVYMGEDWRNVWRVLSIRNSIYREYAEFLDEIETEWHCYKPNPKFDRVNAIFELVDIAHFMLSVLLYDHSTEELSGEVNFPAQKVTQYKSSVEQVELSFTSFMYRPSVWEFVIFLGHACSLLGIDADTYMVAHHKKNVRNQHRALSGVMQGNYDKSSETPLTLEL